MNQYLRLMRLHHWLKSCFVLVGLFFSRQWDNLPLLTDVLLAALAFSIMSSCVYVINDMIDAVYDSQHPDKKHRPLASGKIDVEYAKWLAFSLFIISAFLSSLVSVACFVIILCYLLINISYTYYLKSIAVIDVFCIATGFFLRILTGTIGVGIAPSEWLILCSIMLALFLGFAKRRAELQRDSTRTRPVLNQYSERFLDNAMVLTATCTVLSYAFYALHMELDLHRRLIYTVPIIIYGMLRYMYLVYRGDKAEDPVVALMTDRQLICVLVAWVALTIWALM